MRRKLQGAEATAEASSASVERLLTELAQAGAQSDARFAEQRCRRRYLDGKGPVALRNELAEHHIDAELSARAMAEYDAKWHDLAAEVRRKKFGAPPASYREWAKQARFLQQRGFAAEHIEPFAPFAE